MKFNKSHLIWLILSLILFPIIIHYIKKSERINHENKANSIPISCQTELDIYVEKYKNDRGHLVLNEVYYHPDWFDSWGATVYKLNGDSINEFGEIRNLFLPYRLHKKSGENKLYIEKDSLEYYIELECRDSLDVNW